MSDESSGYEPQYFEAVAKVQAMFAGAPTPGEIVRAVERLGWAPRDFVVKETLESAAQYAERWAAENEEGGHARAAYSVAHAIRCGGVEGSSDSSSTGGEL